MTVVAPLASPDPAPAADALAALGESLAGSRTQIETAFGDVGGRLAQSATLLSRISAVFTALPADLESPELDEATSRLASVGERARQIAASFAGEQSDIARLVSVIRTAERPIAELRRGGKLMGIVAINARVVAAGVASASDDFGVFTSDIAALSAAATRTIAEFSAVYEQVVNEVVDAVGQQARFEATHRDLLSRLAARLDASLAEIVRQQHVSFEGSAETGQVARQIAERIASAVMAMQIGDATRQRLEHIEAALASALAPPAEADPEAAAGIDAPSAGWADAVADICLLQAAHLVDTRATFDREVAEAETALADLAADARTVLVRSRDLYGHDAAQGQSAMSALRSELDLAVEVLRSCEAESRNLESVATTVQATVRGLLERVAAVQDIEANMRLVSLNASVKCAQLGPRGRALNVIATQLRELTGEIVLAADAAAESLSEAAALAQSFSADAAGEAVARIGWLEQEAVAAMSLLQTVDTRLNDALGILGADGPLAIDLLLGAAAGLSGQARISAALRAAQGQLDVLAGEPVDREVHPLARPFLERLRPSYTMTAERRIHDALLGAPADLPPPPEAAAATSFDDVFF